MSIKKRASRSTIGSYTKYIIIFVVILLFATPKLINASKGLFIEKEKPLYTIDYAVVEAYFIGVTQDGLIQARVDGEERLVRLIGVKQLDDEKSIEYLKKTLIGNSKFYLQYDQVKQDGDIILAYIWLNDDFIPGDIIDIENLQLNGFLVKNGIAETERDNVNFLYSDELELIESKYENGKPISF